MKYVVAFPDGWWLRGTVATGDRDRATRYGSEEDARAGLAAAKRFFKPASVRAATVEEVAT
jgi:hypothetical protein